MEPIFTALSSLQTESKRLAVSADNIANAGTPGFRPSRVESVAVAGGGVSVRVVSIDPAVVQVYQPNNPAANGEGFVPMPNIDLSEEFITQILARNAYAASAQLVREEEKRFQSLINIL